MSRRKSSQADGILIILGIIIGIPVFLVNWINEHNAWVWVVSAIIIVAAIVIAIQRKSQADQRKAHADRIKYLQEKYQDAEIVEKIMQGYMWKGQNEEQLLDSLGQPTAIDNHLLKTLTRQVWKYDLAGRGKYRLRITLDDGRVVAWHQRN